MSNEPFTHKLIDSLQEAAPFISGFVLVVVATMKLWWSDRKSTKTRIKNLEVLAENAVYGIDLHNCREEVRKVDEKNMDIVFNELRDMRKDSDNKHGELMNHIINLNKNKRRE